ncbi:MAG: uroporphyrinogen-III synthase [Ginsengibacter sp.]
MDKGEISILSTRPLSKPVLELAVEQSIRLDCISYIETSIIDTEELKIQIDKLAQENVIAVFTSMNAVESVQLHLKNKPNWEIYCMGNTTKELVVNNFGEESLKGIANDAAALAKKIIEHHLKEVVFFCGDIRRDELPEALKKEKIKVTEICVYKTIETPVKLPREYDGVLFFSPSAVRSFFKVNHVSPTTTFFSIGDTTSLEIKKYSSNNIIIADRSIKDDLARQAIHYYNNQTNEHQN